MTPEHKILVIDDEELNFLLIQNALKDSFSLHYVDSGAKAFEYLKTNTVDTILLDVKMPEMDGYEVCRRLKADGNSQDIPIIFVSGLESTEERVAGYEAGGDDYIVKPFQADELRKKAEISVHNKEKLVNLKKQSSNATNAVMTALTTSGELGVVLNFYTRSFTSKSFDELGENLCIALREYGLRSAIQLRPTSELTLEYDTEGVVKPLESSLLTKLKDTKRIYDFDARSIFNFPYLSVLIRNMPLDDSDKYGRHKDNLALLFEGANARVEALNAENSLAEMLKSTKNAMLQIEKNNHEYKVESTHIFENLIIKVEETILTADMTEHQEKALLGLVTDTSDRMNALYDKGQAINDEFVNIALGIEKQLGNSK